jgi:2',3'-cyclic-nucleotide 2'-phosphodiesterase (5'-nucleotidase family)
MIARRRGGLRLVMKAHSCLVAVAVAVAIACVGCRRGERVAPTARPAPSLAGVDASPTVPEADLQPPVAPRGRQIALFYSSNLQGKYAPCNCAVQPLGGLARRATLIGRGRAEADATVVVDAGDLFKPEGTLAETERQGRLLAAGMAHAGIDAFTPGETDLAIGVPLLEKVTSAFKVPVVSANLYGRDGRRLFAADRLLDAAGTRIGIFGVTAPPTAGDANRWRAEGIVVRDPADAAREAARSLRARGAAIVVALVHAGLPAQNRALVREMTGVDWAVLGHSALNLEQPEKAGDALLLEAQSEGKDLGRLDLHLVDGRTTFADRGERPEIAATLADHRRQLGGYDRSLEAMDPAALEDYYRQRRQQLESAIARESAALAALPKVIAGSWFENRVIPLGRDVPDDPAVAELIRAALARGLAEKRHPHL